MTVVRVFGIRHHGPGSARSLLRELVALKPDSVLVEGPPEAESVLRFAADPAMQPPVALLAYVPDRPGIAAFWPFAVFSPEWQALRYAQTSNVVLRFMDLPAASLLALPPAERDAAPSDPFRELAQAAGYSDAGRLWEHLMEERTEDASVFEAVLEATRVLRHHVCEFEARREAAMRARLRETLEEGHRTIAVVCGAWHAPALTDIGSPGDDDAVLRDLTRVPVSLTWVPWTYSHLSRTSGYGAGVSSPGWYHHLWSTAGDIVPRWMSKVADLLRQQELDASPAHVVEAVRLATALARLRGCPAPGLPEMNDACRTVFFHPDDVPMRLIHRQLIVGDRLGKVPDDTPTVPLQSDIWLQQRRLDLLPSAEPTVLSLDLRIPRDLECSRLLHRLAGLSIRWGTVVSGQPRDGTSWEHWRLVWTPGLSLEVVMAAKWGNTVIEAASAALMDAADSAVDLAAISGLLSRALFADLPDGIDYVLIRLDAEAATSSDTLHLMDGLSAVAASLCYGSVRQTHAATLEAIASSMIARICTGLPGVSASLNDTAAHAVVGRMTEVHSWLCSLNRPAYNQQWQDVLHQLADERMTHGRVAGYSCRLMMDLQVMSTVEATTRMQSAFSPGMDTRDSAAYVEGFLGDGGLLLLHHRALWQVLDDWIQSLPEEQFMESLPLLRRTMSTFTPAERRQLWYAASESQPGGVGLELDAERLDEAFSDLTRMLGLENGA